MSLLVAGLAVCAPAAASANGETAPASPQAFAVSSMNGSGVTFSWQAGSTPVDAYVVEGGVLPGQVLASLPVPGSATQLTVMVPDGAFYARVHGVRGGVRGSASNEVRLFVNVPAPPSPPVELTALALGSDVSLAWTNTFGGGTPTALVLDVSGALTASFEVPLSERLEFSGVPNGTYTLSVRARNAAGTSAPAPPVTLSLPGAGVSVLRNPPQALDANRLPVRYENYTAPRLAELVQRENLWAVVAGATSEFDAVLRLKDWVNAQWPLGTPEPYPPWDALVVLDWIRAGITGGFCAQYSQVFLQSLAAFGIPARYVEVGRDVNPYNHYTTEVWSNDFNKWVLMDANFNLHFVGGGAPLSALEVHDALVDGRLGEVAVVHGVQHPGRSSSSEWPLGTAEFYYYLRYHLNANHVSAPAEPAFERFDDMIEWMDDRSVPWEWSEIESEFPKERLTRVQIDDRAAIEGRPNQVWISPRPAASREITLDLQHNVLQPSHYEWRIIDSSGAAGPWQPHGADTLVWSVAPADRVLEVRGVNVRGIPGPSSAVGVTP